MSKEALLPPRYPLQKKNTSNKQDYDSPTSCIGLIRHRKSLSQNTIIEEQPPWFDDLLNDQDTDSYSGFSLSSSSYSSTFFDLLNGLGIGTSTGCESDERLESSCTYGLNSPKIRNQLKIPIISAFSDSVAGSPLEHSDGNPCESGSAQQDKLDSANDESNSEMKPAKRLHPGQRWRARKLQYIAELERTICTLQNFGSELAIKVSVMSQQRSTLQAENSKLKQQMIRLHQEKLLADGQYQSLTKEAERLEASLGAHSCISKISTLNRLSSAAKLVGTEVPWQMLDLRKLDLR